MSIIQRITTALRFSTGTLPSNSDGGCQWCGEFILSGRGVISGRSPFCSEQCREQDDAMRQGR
ncbi:hypothetical protein [Rhodococcus sp. PD04]|uniref:hypothetical protein n=1 Tax=Rhodococcus sp. PD04 TaxID=3109594 RepID=UPI002DD81C81|nr:hypothetical protein [Rhodococcus sp. PD04]WSE21890.1 hypothetical protein U9J23_19835 [Rhodococcus sp. PD04]